MKTIKNKLFLATAILALASCADNTYIGDQDINTPGNGGAISFGSSTGKLTRATSNTAAADHDKLDNQFRVAAVKSGSTTAGSDMQKVFNNYGVWYNTTHTTSNSANWEYVETSTSGVEHGSSGSGANSMVLSNQTIKYWDFSAKDYRFVAGSPYAAFVFTIDNNNNITGATVKDGYLAGHITANNSTSNNVQPLYIAQPIKTTAEAHATTPVQFQFVRQQTQVRVGVYETIPGYKITSISFYPYGDSDWGTKDANNNIILAAPTTDGNYFQGGTSANVTGTIVYNWNNTPSYTFTYSDKDANSQKTITTSKNWYGGKLSLSADHPLAITSTTTATDKAYFYGTDGDMDATTGYFTVFPTQVATAAPILIKCDYTLTSEVDNSGETINVTGATAAIPAAYTLWKTNTSYTYIFKISDNTNGSTGGSSVGLYPITFDAVTIAEEASTQQGTITTVSTPSISTYQAGSVVDTTDPAVHGIKYTTTNGAIYFTAQNNTTGGLNNLKALGTTSEATGEVGMVQVYKLSGAATEADLIITRPTTTFTTSVGGAAWTINGQSVESGKWASFTPDATGYYAIEYLTGFDSGTIINTETSAVGYYKRTGDSSSYTYKLVTSGNGDGTSTYCKAAFAYKVVHVE